MDDFLKVDVKIVHASSIEELQEKVLKQLEENGKADSDNWEPLGCPSIDISGEGSGLLQLFYQPGADDNIFTEDWEIISSDSYSELMGDVHVQLEENGESEDGSVFEPEGAPFFFQGKWHVAMKFANEF